MERKKIDWINSFLFLFSLYIQMKLSKKYKYVIYLKFKYTYNTYTYKYSTTTYNAYKSSLKTTTSGIIIFLNFHEKENELNFLILDKNNIGIHKKLSHRVVNSIFKKSTNASFSLDNFLYSILSIKDKDVPMTILWKEKR